MFDYAWNFIGALLIGYIGVEAFRSGNRILKKKRFILPEYEFAFWARKRGREWALLKEKSMAKTRPWKMWGWLNRFGGVFLFVCAIFIVVFSFAV